MQRRNFVALVGALFFVVALIALYLFFDRVWPLLPPWISVPLCVLFAAFVIGSPIYTLLRLSDRMPRHSRAGPNAGVREPLDRKVTPPRTRSPG